MITGFRLAAMLAFRREAVREEIVKVSRRFFDEDRKLNVLRVREALAWRDYGEGDGSEAPLPVSVTQVLEARAEQAMRCLADASAADADLARLGAVREAAVREAEEAAENFRCRERALVDAWKASASCAALSSAVSRAEEALETVRQQASGPLLAERDERIRRIESDRFYAYLVERGYGTASYRGRGLKRILDAWLARVSGHEAAVRARAELEAWPELMRQRLAGCEAARDAAEERFRLAARQATEPLDALRPALAAALNRRQEAEDRHAALVARRDGAMKKISDAVSGRDSSYIDMVEAFADFLAREKSGAMKRIASGQTDVVADPRIDRLSSDRIRLSMETDSLRRHISGALARLRAVETVSARLAGEGMDGEASCFSLDEHGWLPESLASGGLSADEAWARIVRARVPSPGVEMKAAA